LPAPASEEATPDCGLDPPDDDPQQERIARLASLGVERWHAAGIRGKGVKIAVLDTGFRNYRSLLGKALPRQVTVRCFRDDGDFEGRDSQHGILCSEVLHALAPEAELLLATWEPSSPEQFLQAVRWAKQQGARVLSCSIIMPSWSDGEGGGPVHAALAQIVGSGKGPGDMLCFASAGNTARRHWSGPFQNAGDGYHEWRPRCKENRIKPWGEERISVELCCPAECRYQVQVHASPAGIEVGRATSGGPSNRGCAVVRFTPQPGQRYRLKLRHADGPARPFHVVVLGGELDCSVPHGSITFPGDGGEVLAVGAVDAKGQRLAYSSCGPNSLRPKPDFVAPVPFTTLWRDRPFTGTSAAAPQVAGLAALCWSRNPGWTAEQVRDTLRHWAKDLGQPGHDCETGYGQVLLPPP
jgi:subtilisin family serine protease